MDANPTLDQLQVFLAVVEAGSFSAAARALNRAQSVVSYTIANLEAQLEVSLFERSGARQPRLTEAGRAMVTDARRILSGLQVMRAKAKSLKHGLEAEVSIAFSTMVPSGLLVSVLRRFRSEFPTVSLHLTVGELGRVMEMVTTAQADIGIGGAVTDRVDGVEADRIGYTFLVPVAAADHPLAKLAGPLSVADVREEVQLVVTDASGATKGRDFNLLSYKTWKVSDIATKHNLILGGLGWGGLPVSVIEKDLREGRLVPLRLDAYEHCEYPIYAMRRTANPPGPAAAWLIEAFRAQFVRCPDQQDFLENLTRDQAEDAAPRPHRAVVVPRDKIHDPADADELRIG